jgi:voltage-gated potassium channel
MKLEKLKPAYYSIFLLITIFIVGIVGFMMIEKYSLLDSFFMTIITVTTVGFGEVHPLSPEGKIFTSFLIIFSFGTFAFSATTLVQYIANGVFFNYFKYSKVKNEIDHLKHHVIIVGYGRNGSQAIEELKNHHIPLVVIENRDAKLKEIQQGNLLYIDDDPSSDEALIRAGILKAKALICVLPTDEENLFVVITARSLNPHLTIISRAINFNTIKKLKIAGASHVIMPDKISGQHMANMIAQPDILEFMYYLMLENSKDTSLEEITCSGISGDQSLTLKDLRNEGNINIIGIKRTDGHYVVNPAPGLPLIDGDILFALGTPEGIQGFKKAFKESVEIRTKSQESGLGLQ